MDVYQPSVLEYNEPEAIYLVVQPGPGVGEERGLENRLPNFHVRHRKYRKGGFHIQGTAF